MTWRLWADGETRYEAAALPEQDPPAEAELSADGLWATLYENGRPIRTWVRAGSRPAEPVPLGTERTEGS